MKIVEKSRYYEKYQQIGYYRDFEEIGIL